MLQSPTRFGEAARVLTWRRVKSRMSDRDDVEDVDEDEQHASVPPSAHPTR